jgi:hypothetical protein
MIDRNGSVRSRLEMKCPAGGSFGVAQSPKSSHGGTFGIIQAAKLIARVFSIFPCRMPRRAFRVPATGPFYCAVETIGLFRVVVLADSWHRNCLSRLVESDCHLVQDRQKILKYERLVCRAQVP